MVMRLRYIVLAQRKLGQTIVDEWGATESLKVNIPFHASMALNTSPGNTADSTFQYRRTVGMVL